MANTFYVKSDRSALARVSNAVVDGDQRADDGSEKAGRFVSARDVTLSSSTTGAAARARMSLLVEQQRGDH